MMPPWIIKFKIPGSIRAITFWPFIIMENPNDLKVFQHEMVHIKQQLRGWLIFFYIKYLYYQIRYGYDKNPYEIEAREISGVR